VLPVVLRFVPLEVAAPVIVWFGLATVGQAFSEVPKTEAFAVAMGLLPVLAQWATTLADTIARKAGTSLYALAPTMGSDLALGGLIALGQGSLLTGMLWCAALALVVQRRFAAAAGWVGAMAVLSAFGVIHAYTLAPEGVESVIRWGAAPAFAWSYAAGAAFLLICSRRSENRAGQ
jgi:AGZA family xanthine/uracil permease-like MFS transporter